MNIVLKRVLSLARQALSSLCPCCGTVLEGKTSEWLVEFSQLVDDLKLPPWPGLAESWDAFTMLDTRRAE